MNCKERYLAAVNHKNPDRIPLDLGAGKAITYNIHFYKKLLKYLGIEETPMVGSKASQTAIVSDAVYEKLECDIRQAWPAYGAGGSHSYGTADTPNSWEDDEYYYFVNDFGTHLRMPK